MGLFARLFGLEQRPAPRRSRHHPVLREWHARLAGQASGISLEDLYGGDEVAKEGFIEGIKSLVEGGLQIVLEDYPGEQDRMMWSMMAGSTMAAMTQEHQYKVWQMTNELVRAGISEEGEDFFQGFQLAFLHAFYAKSVERMDIRPSAPFPSLERTMTWFGRIGTPQQAARRSEKLKALADRLGISHSG